MGHCHGCGCPKDKCSSYHGMVQRVCCPECDHRNIVKKDCGCKPCTTFLQDALEEAVKLIGEAECGMHKYDDEGYRHNWFKRVEDFEKSFKA